MNAVISRVIGNGRPEVHIIGSNYGGRPDPNAVQIAQYLLNENQPVVVISEFESGFPNGVRVVGRGSYAAAAFFISAHACYYTHSLSDVIPFGHRLFGAGQFFCLPKLIFLQHGVIGLKSRLGNGVSMAKYMQSLEPTFDLMVVSSEREKGLVQKFGVAESKIAITGLPRFDRYLPSSQTARKVLVFFTWQGVDCLRDKISKVLNCHGIRAMQKAGFEVLVHYHDMQDLGGDERTLNHESLTQDAIEKGMLLITDDSSLAWDFFYRQQAVCFYQSAKDWLIGSEEFEGFRCSDQAELDQWLDNYLEGTGPQPFRFSRFYDEENSKRLIDLIGLIPADELNHA